MAEDRRPGKYDTPTRGNGKTPPTQTGGPVRADRTGAGARQPRGPAGIIVLLMLVLLTIIAVNTLGPKPETISFSQLIAYNQERSLKDVKLHLSEITATVESTVNTNKKKTVRVRVPVNPNEASQADAIQRLNQAGIEFEQQGGPSLWVQILLSPLPIFLIFVVLIWLFFRGIRSASGGGGMIGNFGKSRHRILSKESTNITFDDVAGISEAKEELQEIVEFLRYPKKFMRLGGRVPRGVLLSGQPGCGKTLLAKAIAGEADVPFFTISGSDFVEMFVGVGASRVRDLFKQAKENSPCIIFLDEIDAVGRRRGGGVSSGGNDEREQTLNAILVEMDGFETSDQVIVIASTNRPDVLDPALTRPGRFDRHVTVPMPDVKGRYEILKVHAKKVKLGPNVNLERIARATPMFSGAELAAIMNEAAIIATLQDKDFIEHEDLEEARDKVRYGRSQKSRVIEEKERIATAYHEAGHAVLQAMLPDADPLHKVTIIPRGQSMGATFSLPEKDRYGYGLKYIMATMRVVCGGRIAEKRKTDDVSSGASMDIKQLTQMAKAMVLEWGMSEKLGFVKYSPSEDAAGYIEREYSDETARIIDEEIRRYAAEAYEEAERILFENWEKVEAVAEALLKHETLEADDVHRLMRGEPLGKPSVSDLLAAESKKDAGLRASGSKPERKTADGEDENLGGVVPSPA
ncbi:MAG: ATP-dependent zinc metalloprotease FtsH [Phycisphaerales bacterium JB050]